MNTFLKRILIILSIVALGLFLYSTFVENIFENRLSPKDSVEFKLNDLKLKVSYNRPSKKGT
jgi:YbbR domain-containing protein